MGEIHKLRRTVKSTLKIFIYFILGSIFFELLVENYMFFKSKNSQEYPWPYYHWSFYTSEGQRLGNQRGMLKLMYHPQLVYVNFPNQKTKYFSINSEGFRGPEITDKKIGEKRIVVVGGSSAFGTGLLSDEETFEAKLAQKDKNIQVINAAVVGYKSTQELVFLMEKGMDFHPDLIIAFDGSNDLWGLDQRWPEVAGGYMIEDDLKYLDGFLYSSFFIRFFNIYKSLFAKTVYYFFTREKLEDLNSDIDKSKFISIYCANILKMDRLAKSYHANFICFLQPLKHVMYGTRLVRGKSFFSKAKEVFDRNNIRYVDLNLYQGVIKEEYFNDTIHLDARGNEAIADIIYNRLHQGNLL